MNRFLSRIGVYVDNHEVTVVRIERGVMAWSETVVLSVASQPGDYTAVAGTLDSILDRIPKRRWPATRVEIAVGSPWARVKVIRGVAAVHSHSELISMLRLNTMKFVAASHPVIISGAATTTGGDVCVGIVDSGAIGTVTRAVNDRNFRIGRVVPAVALEKHLAPMDTSDYADTVRDSQWQASIATLVATIHGPIMLGLASRDNPSLTRPPVSRTRVTLAGAALVLAIGVYICGQSYSDRARLSHDSAAIDSIASVSDSGVHEQAYLRRLQADLARVAQFARRRKSASVVIGEITHSLPPEAAITTLRIDTSNVDVVVLSPRTAAVINAFSELPDLDSPVIIGPVSREAIGSKEVERATIRLRVSPDYSHDKTAFVVARENDR